jgi:hypothetical protein
MFWQSIANKTFQDIRPSAWILPKVIAAGVRVLIYSGDADWTCSYIANSREADSVVWPKQANFNNKAMLPYKVNGVERGSLKTVDNFSYMRVNEAGHDLAYYREYSGFETGYFNDYMTNIPNRTRVSATGACSDDEWNIRVYVDHTLLSSHLDCPYLEFTW